MARVIKLLSASFCHSRRTIERSRGNFCPWKSLETSAKAFERRIKLRNENFHFRGSISSPKAIVCDYHGNILRFSNLMFQNTRKILYPVRFSRYLQPFIDDGMHENEREGERGRELEACFLEYTIIPLRCSPVTGGRTKMESVAGTA